MDKDNHQTIKEKIARQAWRIIPFEGFSLYALRNASQKAGFDKYMGEIVFKEAEKGLINHMMKERNHKMQDFLHNLRLKNMRVRDRIREAVKYRVSIATTNKILTIKLLSYFALPFNLALKLQIYWQVADMIWNEVAPSSNIDFNYYTKRTLLAGVYGATLMYRLSDESEDNQDTWNFLDRSIDNIIVIGKFIKGKP